MACTPWENSDIHASALHTYHTGPLAEEQMYGVAFVVEEVDLLLKPREFLRGAGADVHEEGREALPPPLSRDDLEAWFTARLGSITGQVMSSCKVRAPNEALGFLFSGPCDRQVVHFSPRHPNLFPQPQTRQSACRAAFLSSPVRLVEALFECDLQCDRVR